MQDTDEVASAQACEITVTIDDRPREDIAVAVKDGTVSNRLILYVRRMMAAERASTAKLFELVGTPPHVDREDIAAEVFEACDLEEHGEPEGYLGTAWTIAEAAGWDHLAGDPAAPDPAPAAPPPEPRSMEWLLDVRRELVEAAQGKTCQAIYEIERYGDIVAARRMLEQACSMLARAQGMSTAALVVFREQGS